MYNHCSGGGGAGAGKSEDQCHPGLHDEPLSQRKQQRLNHCFPLKAPVQRKIHWETQKAFLSFFPTLLSRINFCFVCLIYRVLSREPRVSGEKGGIFCLPHCQHSSAMCLSGKKRMSGNEWCLLHTVLSLQSWHCSLLSSSLCFLLVFEVLEWNPGPVACSSFRLRSLQSTLVLGITALHRVCPWTCFQGSHWRVCDRQDSTKA